VFRLLFVLAAGYEFSLLPTSHLLYVRYGFSLSHVCVSSVCRLHLVFCASSACHLRLDMGVSSACHLRLIRCVLKLVFLLSYVCVSSVCRLRLVFCASSACHLRLIGGASSACRLPLVCCVIDTCVLAFLCLCEFSVSPTSRV
jgi:hypothetical protein